MVSVPPGLLTCFERLKALRTLSRVAGAWALGIGLLLIGLQVQGAAAARRAGPPGRPAPSRTAEPHPAPTHTLLVFGDSLSAAHGLDIGQGWVALLRKRLDDKGYGYRIVNASVSGETTTGGLDRLPRELRLHRPAIVLLELGANDGLRGLPVEAARGRLARMIELCRRADARVLLLGIRLPPNYGPRYGEPFAAMYGELSRHFHVPLVPFLLRGVALKPDLMQSDGLHPNARGEEPVLDNVWPYLLPLLGKAPCGSDRSCKRSG